MYLEVDDRHDEYRKLYFTKSHNNAMNSHLKPFYIDWRLLIYDQIDTYDWTRCNHDIGITNTLTNLSSIQLKVVYRYFQMLLLFWKHNMPLQPLNASFSVILLINFRPKLWRNTPHRMVTKTRCFFSETLITTTSNKLWLVLCWLNVSYSCRNSDPLIMGMNHHNLKKKPSMII